MAGGPVAPEMTMSIRLAMRLAADTLARGSASIGDDWVVGGACLGMDTDRVFYTPPKYTRAYDTCARCSVAVECLAEALLEERKVPQQLLCGVRGGQAPRERLWLAIESGVRKSVPATMEAKAG